MTATDAQRGPRPAPYTFNGTVALQARLRKGWTQRQVQARTKELGREVDDSNLSKYERGDACPSAPFLAVLAEAYGLEVDALITLRTEAAA
jgi:transcriptional regulator with XRE-family HTH domain